MWLCTILLVLCRLYSCNIFCVWFPPRLLFRVVKATFAGPLAPHLDLWQYPVDNIRELQTLPHDDANGTMF